MLQTQQLSDVIQTLSRNIIYTYLRTE